MKNKKGFTLIELVVIIVLIGVVSLIAVPITLNVVKSSKQKAYEEIVSNIENAAYNYSLYNELEYNPLYRTLEVSTIQTAGYLPNETIIDPRTDEELSGCVLYRWDSDVSQYDFVYQDECLPSSLNPEVVINVVNDNNLPWMNEYIQLELTGEYDGFKYCVGENNCEYDTDYVGPKKVAKTGKDIYICAIGYVDDVYGNSTCTRAYNVDLEKPEFTVLTTKSTSSKIVVSAKCSDDLSLVKDIRYSIDGGEYQDSNVFENLKTGEHEVLISCRDNALNETVERRIVTTTIPVPLIAQSNQVPVDTTYAIERKITITFNGTDVDGPKYYFKSSVEASVPSGLVTHYCGKDTVPKDCKKNSSVIELQKDMWYKTETLIVPLTYTKNGFLYAMTMDEVGNKEVASTFTIANIDSTAPNASFESLELKTDSIKVTANCSDSESGITKYEFKLDNGNWIDNGLNKEYEFNGLTSNKNYIVSVRCTNGAAVTSEFSDGTVPPLPRVPSIDFVSQVPTGMDYAQQKNYKVTYYDTDSNNNVIITSPYYYFKSDVRVTLDKNAISYCGNGTMPSNCIASSVAILDANTWYKVPKTFNLTIKANGTLYAMTKDGSNNSSLTVTEEVVKIDTTPPICNIVFDDVLSDRVTVIANGSDSESGITKYEFKLNDDLSDWKVFESKDSSYSYTFEGLNSNTKYSFIARCTNGSGMPTTVSSSKTPCSIKAPVITKDSQDPIGNTYAKKIILKLAYSSECVNDAKYWYSYDAKDWVEVTDETVYLTYNNSSYNGKTIYARTTDPSNNESAYATYTIVNIDDKDVVATISSISTSTNSAIISASCSEVLSGSSLLYRVNNGNWQTSNIFTGLTSGNTYTFEAKCTSGVGKIGTDNETAILPVIKSPYIIQTTQYPSVGKYARERRINITYYPNNIVNPVYYVKATGNVAYIMDVDTSTTSPITGICGTGTNPGTCIDVSTVIGKLEPGNWYRVSSTQLNLMYQANGGLYAATGDGNNLSASSNYSIVNMDTSSPNITLGTVSKTSNSITVPFTAGDSESGIEYTMCQYSTSNSFGSYFTFANNSKCEFKGLNAGTTYYYKIITKNGTGLYSFVTGSAKTIDLCSPDIMQIAQSPSVGKYARERRYRIDYCADSYYVKTTTTAYIDAVDTAITSPVVATCGTGTNPGTCTNTTSIIGVLSPNVWYKVSSDQLYLLYQSNGVLYAAVGDGTNISKTVTENIVNIDTSNPNLTLKTATTTSNSITVPFTASDSESGIESIKCEYGTSTSYGSVGTVSGNNCVMSGLKSGTKYYYMIIAKNGSGLYNSVSGSGTSNNLCKPTISENSATKYDEWSDYRKYDITYCSTNISAPSYYFKSTVGGTLSSGTITHTCGQGTTPGSCSITDTKNISANTWYKASSTNIQIIYYYGDADYLYAIVMDSSNNKSETASYYISNIDSTAPDMDKPYYYTEETSAYIDVGCYDDESGISSYYISLGDQSYSVNTSDDFVSHIFKELTPGTTYDVVVSCDNNAYGSTYESFTVTTQDYPVIACDIEQVGQIPEDTKIYPTYAQQRIINVSCDDDYNTTQVYYIKSAGADAYIEGVSSGNTSYLLTSCGTGTNPGICFNTSDWYLKADTWYTLNAIDVANINLVYSNNATIYTITENLDNYKTADSSYSVVNMDTTGPIVAISSISTTYNSATISATCNDSQSGIVKYAFSKDNGANWTTYSSTATSYTHTFTGLTQGTTYSFKVMCTNGSDLSKTLSRSNATKDVYTISYNLNGGTGSISSISKIQYETVYITTEVPTRENYTFAGWGTSPTDRTVDYAPGASYTSNSSITLYAIWEGQNSQYFTCDSGDSLIFDSQLGYICVTDSYEICSGYDYICDYYEYDVECDSSLRYHPYANFTKDECYELIDSWSCGEDYLWDYVSYDITYAVQSPQGVPYDEYTVRAYWYDCSNESTKIDTYCTNDPNSTSNLCNKSSSQYYDVCLGYNQSYTVCEGESWETEYDEYWINCRKNGSQCPTGYTLYSSDNSKCYKMPNSDSSLCPSGTVVYNYSTNKYRCKISAEVEDSECIRENCDWTCVDLDESCPDGYYEDGYCRDAPREDANITGKSCTEIYCDCSEYDYTYTCSSGWTLSGYSCYKDLFEVN